MAEVAEGQRICRQVGNISAIFAKRASNVDEGQEKERYITNIESARKEIHTGCALQIHSFRDTPLAIHGRLKASVLSVRGILYQLAWSKANQQRRNSISVGLVEGKSAEVCFTEISPSKVQ